MMPNVDDAAMNPSVPENSTVTDDQVTPLSLDSLIVLSLTTPAIFVPSDETTMFFQVLEPEAVCFVHVTPSGDV